MMQNLSEIQIFSLFILPNFYLKTYLFSYHFNSAVIPNADD